MARVMTTSLGRSLGDVPTGLGTKLNKVESAIEQHENNGAVKMVLERN